MQLSSRLLNHSKVTHYVLVFSLFGTPTNPTKEAIPFCEASKEFVTTNEFLKAEKQYFRSADQALATAKKVADGCTGAAARFIKTVKALGKTDLTIGQIISAAEQAAQKSDETSEAFLKIFSRLYASDDFDFDLETSLKMARSLSVDFKGEVESSIKDFESISKFCLATEGLNFGKAKCAELARNVALTSEKHYASVGKAFETGYQYLVNPKGPQMVPLEASKQIMELVVIHPEAVNNFKTAYEYAISEKGLAVNRSESIKFAKLMAQKTLEPEALKSEAKNSN
jgi:hypothetical protein